MFCKNKMYEIFLIVVIFLFIFYFLQNFPKPRRNLILLFLIFASLLYFVYDNSKLFIINETNSEFIHPAFL